MTKAKTKSSGPSNRPSWKDSAELVDLLASHPLVRDYEDFLDLESIRICTLCEYPGEDLVDLYLEKDGEVFVLSDVGNTLWMINILDSSDIPPICSSQIAAKLNDFTLYLPIDKEFKNLAKAITQLATVCSVIAEVYFKP